MSGYRKRALVHHLQVFCAIVVFGISLANCGSGGGGGTSDATNGAEPIATVDSAVNTSQTGAMPQGHVVRTPRYHRLV